MMKTFLLMFIQLTLDKPIIFRNIFAAAVQSWCLTHTMNMTVSSRTQYYAATTAIISVLSYLLYESQNSR
jgi:hypothetical protein